MTPAPFRFSCSRFPREARGEGQQRFGLEDQLETELNDARPARSEYGVRSAGIGRECGAAESGTSRRIGCAGAAARAAEGWRS